MTTGALYALIALGLTLIYGVLHIINFAHGALLMLALYAVYLPVTPARASTPMWRSSSCRRRCSRSATRCNGASSAARAHGRDENILLVTLGLSIVHREPRADASSAPTRSTVDTPYSFQTVNVLGAFLPLPKVGGLRSARWSRRWRSGLFMTRTDLGRAIRALAKERKGAQLVGIDVDHVYAMSFGIGIGVPGRRRLPADAELLRRSPASATASC